MTIPLLKETSINISFRMYKLPTLYNIDKRGNERSWEATVTGNTVKWYQGIVGGKQQEYNRTFEGKNVGKINETTSEEQAKRASEKMWVDQISKGYKPKCVNGTEMFVKVQAVSNMNGGHNVNASSAIRERKEKLIKSKDTFTVDQVKNVIKPMKATLLIDEKSPKSKPGTLQPKVSKYFDFTLGVYLQWKLDGWRCIAREQDGICVLTTNNCKQYPWFGSLREVLLKFMKGNNILDGLDGELYCHNLYDEKGVELDQDQRFSTISSMCGIARSMPHPCESQICLYVFDLVDLSGKIPFEERYKKLCTLFSDQKDKKVVSRIVLCDTKKVHSIDAIFEYHDEAAGNDYEGVMIRSANGIYSNNRSLTLRKYKQFMDAEFEVVGVRKDAGVDDENFTFMMKTKDCKYFNAKPVGTILARQTMYRNWGIYNGKMMTVKFQGYSDSGIPRFPIARCVIREDK